MTTESAFSHTPAELFAPSENITDDAPITGNLITARSEISSEVDHEALLSRAKRGDAEAASRIVISLLPYWLGAANKILQSPDEAEDLVQEAVAKLLALWRSGEGPDTNAAAYVATTMRNSHLMRMRSPASRTSSLEQLQETQPSIEALHTTETSDPDFTLEYAAVARALNALSPEYRTALIAILVEGKKPATLVEELGRPAPAISSLLARAKQALRRQLLIEYLAEGTNECAANAHMLPARIHDLAQHERHERGIPHAKNCSHCTKNWSRFAAIASTLGVLPLFVLYEHIHLVSPAAAVSTNASDTENGKSPTQQATEPAFTEAKVPEPIRSSGTVTKFLTSRAVFYAGAALVGCAGILLAIHTSTYSQDTLVTGEAATNSSTSEAVTNASRSDDAGEQAANFSTSVTTDKSGALTSISTRLTLQDVTSWEFHELVLSSSPWLEATSASNGLECTFEPGETVCALTDSTDLSSPLAFIVSDESTGLAGERGSFTLRITASGDNGESLEAISQGSW